MDALISTYEILCIEWKILHAIFFFYLDKVGNWLVISQTFWIFI